jgi:hypothetical protein
MILEHNNFKIVVGQADPPGDLEIAAIISYPGDKSEAGTILRAVHRQMKARDGPAELPEAPMPVGQFAQLALEIQVEFVDYARVKPHSRHKDEMAARLAGSCERAQRDANGRGVQ